MSDAMPGTGDSIPSAAAPVPAADACVSVVIPCYNHGRCLARAVQSLIDQTYAHTQIVVVDDGSSDDTAAVARSFGARVEYVHQANAGLSAARNTGLRHARGEWVVFLDADDWLPPDALRQHLEAAQSHPAASVFCGGWRVVDDQGALLHENEAPAFQPDSFHGLLPYNPGPCHAYMVRKRVLDKAGPFDAGLRSCEDWDMWLRIAAAGQEFVRVPAMVAVYRRAPGTMSTNTPRMVQTAMAVLTRARRVHPGCAICRERIAAGFKQCHDTYVADSFYGGLALAREGKPVAALRRAGAMVVRVPSTLPALGLVAARYFRQRWRRGRPSPEADKTTVK